MVKTVVDVAGGKVPVVVGASHAGTKPAIERAKYVEDIGGDGIMIVLPYYHVPEEDGLYLHYKRIYDSVNIGVVIYNNPDVSKIYMKPHILKKLSEETKNIVAVKENTPYIPKFSVDLLKAGLNGDYNKVREYMEKIWYLEEFVNRMSKKYGPSSTILPHPYVQSYMIYSIIKAAMDILGLKGGSVRGPLINIDDNDKKELEKILFGKLNLQKIG